MKEYRIATRGSLLALAQANSIRRKLEEAGEKAGLLVVETKGDRDRVHALQDIGGDGLFVRAIEQALLDNEADIAVHSGKDLPYDLQNGLVIGGVPAAEAPFDALVWPEGVDAAALRRIGTGSPRRVSQLRPLFPDAEFVPIRGNINTRINKVRQGEVDAVILARAGMIRLEADADSQRAQTGAFSLAGMQVRSFTLDEVLPAACQGILALECRADDEETKALLARICDAQAYQRFTLERAVFTGMKADCRTVLGANASLEGDTLTLRAMFAGKKTVVTGPMSQRAALVEQVIQSIYVPQGSR